MRCMIPYKLYIPSILHFAFELFCKDTEADVFLAQEKSLKARDISSRCSLISQGVNECEFSFSFVPATVNGIKPYKMLVVITAHKDGVISADVYGSLKYREQLKQPMDAWMAHMSHEGYIFIQ